MHILPTERSSERCTTRIMELQRNSVTTPGYRDHPKKCQHIIIIYYQAKASEFTDTPLAPSAASSSLHKSSATLHA